MYEIKGQENRSPQASRSLPSLQFTREQLDPEWANALVASSTATATAIDEKQAVGTYATRKVRGHEREWACWSRPVRPAVNSRRAACWEN